MRTLIRSTSRRACFTLICGLVIFAGCSEEPARPGAGPGEEAGEIPRATDTPEVAPLRLTPRLTQILEPSAAPITVTWDGRITVTVPGGALDEPRRITVSTVDTPPPPSHAGVVQTAVFEVAIEGMTTFQDEVRIEVPLSRAGWSDEYPPEAQIAAEYWEPAMGQWYPVRCHVDPQRDSVTIVTRHLSTYCVLNPQGGGQYRLWVCRSGKEKGEAIFSIHYDEKAVRAGTLAFKSEKLRFELNKLGSDTLPGYIAKLAEYANDAHAAYRRIGLDPYTKPLHVYVDTAKNIASSYHNEWTGNIGFNTSAHSLEALRYAIAHELFHNIQLNYYWPHTFPFRRSFLEATAEFAACKVAMDGYEFWGKLDRPYRQRKLSTYLTKDLYYARARPAAEGADPWVNHEYAAAYFVDFICSRKATALLPEAEYFARLLQGATPRGDWNGLEAYLGHEHGDLYSDFAVDHLLQSGSPMYFALTPGTDEVVYRKSGPVTDAALDATLQLSEDGKSQQHVFRFDERMTTHVVKAVVPAPRSETWLATVVPSAPVLEGLRLQACVLTADDRSRGFVARRLELGTAATATPLALRKGDALYIVASSPSAVGTAAVNVTALDLESTPLRATATLSVTPAAWGKAQTRMTLTCAGALASSRAMSKTVTADAGYVGYEHVQILSSRYCEPLILDVRAEYEFEKGAKFRYSDHFGDEVGSGFVEIRLGSPRLEARIGSTMQELTGTSGTFTIPVAPGTTPDVKVFLVLTCQAEFFREGSGGVSEPVKKDSNDMRFLLVDMHGGGW